MKMITEANVSALLASLNEHYPGFALVTKPFDSRRCTTWNTTIYVPTLWDTLSYYQRYIRLTHEAVHLAQFVRLGTWTFGAKYATPWGRTSLEREAFMEEFVAVEACYGAASLLAKRDYYVSLFTGRAYYWCCPCPGVAAAWVDAMLQIVLDLAREQGRTF